MLDHQTWTISKAFNVDDKECSSAKGSACFVMSEELLAQTWHKIGVHLSFVVYQSQNIANIQFHP